MSTLPSDGPAGVDPFFGGVWSAPGKVAWTSVSESRRAERAGFGRLPGQWQMDEDQAWTKVTSVARLGDVVEALGAINQWRSMSMTQLAQLTGRKSLGVLDPKGGSLIAAMFTVGLVDFGLPMLPLRFIAGARPAQVQVALSRTDVFWNRLAPLLTDAELVRITGGQGFAALRVSERHNMLAVELGLRVAAQCDVIAVLGESMSSIRQLAYEPVRATAPKHMSASADLTVVRADGLRVAVEVTATAGSRFKDKVMRWAEALARSPFDLSGVMVVFVEAAPVERPSGKKVMREIRQAVIAAVRQFPGVSADRVAERIGVASWASWFPQVGVTDPSFPLLRVERPVGPTGDGRWVEVNALDVFDLSFTPKRPEAMVAVRDNARVLAGSPLELESRIRGTAPDLLGWRLAARGFDPIPIPAEQSRPRAGLDSGWVPPRCEVARSVRSRVDEHGWPPH